MTAKHIATVVKGRREEFRVVLRPFSGKPMVEVRLHRVGGRGMAPTDSAIVLRPDLVAGLAEALQAAQVAVEAEGLLTEGGAA